MAAGFVAVLVGFTSSIAIVFAAARGFGASDAVVTSWVWALCVGQGAMGLFLSLKWRMPVMVAWSTPGAAVLATAAKGYTLGQAVGAFLVCAVAIAVVGFTGWFERAINKIPLSLASGLLAGVLSRFALDGFSAAATRPAIVISMFVAYLVGRRALARYAVVLTLIVGIAVAAMTNDLKVDELTWSIATPVFTRPSWSLAAIISLAVPLFVVTMAGQNLPGIAAIRAAEYPVPVSKVIGFTGVLTFLIAPFGGYALNLSAITAAICMGPESHPDRDRRYTAAATTGALYMAIGLVGTVVTGLLNAFPAALVRAIAALALVSTISASLATASAEPATRDAAIVTFLVTLSGVTMLRIGSPFWGALAGVLAYGALTLRRLNA